MMRLGTRLECVRSLPRVSGVYQDGAREFVGRRSRLTRRLSRVAEMLVGSSDDVVGAYREFTRGSLKEWGSSLGTRREIVGGRP
ncbi:hypothetical protein BHE74_00017951 [Ensete ventricosum]|nr:hypothetical protein BHE74_00017951 [Ensete ventricosum]